MNALPSLEQPRARAWAIPGAVALGCAALTARSMSLLALGPTIAVGVLGVVGAVGTKQISRAQR